MYHGRNIHVFLIKSANNLMPSYPGPPMVNVWWLDSNFLWTRYIQQIKNGALMPSVLIIFGHPIFELGSMLVMRILNQTTIGHADIVEKRTSGDWHHYVLAVTLPKLTLKPFAFSDAWLLRCKHYMVIASSQAGRDEAIMLKNLPFMLYWNA